MKIKMLLVCGFICSDLVMSSRGQITNAAPIAPILTFSLLNDSGIGTNQFNANAVINDMLTASGTNSFYCRHLPYDQSYDFHLFDGKGQEMQKTVIGLAHSHAENPSPSGMVAIRRFKPQAVMDSSVNQWFRPADLFVITNKGVYELEVRYRLLVPMTNGIPDYSATGTGSKFIAAKKFGVITSAPVRVKVIKE